VGAKRPKFDAPRGPGNASGGKRAIPSAREAVGPDTRASLWYKKRTVIVKVVKVEPENRYEGVIEAFEPAADTYKELSVGDTVTFRRDKIQWVH